MHNGSTHMYSQWKDEFVTSHYAQSYIRVHEFGYWIKHIFKDRGTL